MPIQVALHHETVYSYDRAVTLSPHVIRLRPAPHCRTPVLSYALNVRPRQHFLNWQQDPYNNYLARLVFPEPARELRVEVDLIAELTVINPFDFYVEGYAEKYPFAYDRDSARELVPYLQAEAPGPRLQSLIGELRRADLRTVDYLVEINQALQQRIDYVIRLEPGLQTCEQTLELARGSCRDTAWVLVQLLRNLGLAARFVSGYLIQLKPDVKPLDGPAGAASDFTDLHAWTEAYVPGAGWIGLDPTSGLLAGEGHIPLACSADPVTAAPITGAFTPKYPPQPGEPEEVQSEFSFSMAVSRVHEPPRVTKPYTDRQWHDIEQLGRLIDARLDAGDVRLTMGGEPTFVSIDDMQGDEWNYTALGPTKRRLAGDLLRRLHARFAPGGLLQYAQGKWYPGEPLPRWALYCYWRKDGVPVWQDMALVAVEGKTYPHDRQTAHRFITALAERLGVDPGCAVPGYEDVWYYLWKERRLPVNTDPLESKLDDEMERQRLARVFEQGLGSAVGYALPLDRRVAPPGPRGAGGNHLGEHKVWVSGRWFFRPEHMFLLPGDSPMGLRLPLDSLPWVPPEYAAVVHEFDPSAPQDGIVRAGWNRGLDQIRNLSDSRHRAADLSLQLRGHPALPHQRGPAGDGRPAAPFMEQHLDGIGGPPVGPDVIRTALCVEPRDGHLYVFLPPTRSLDDFLDLVRAVEETARELDTPVLLEGYPPPSDPRLNHFSVTPDPGVIEVNIHPARSWDELVRNTTTLYEEARLSRLGTEKFMLDGRHTGTGGGNHILLGGRTVTDSPVLRRPDLLRSLVGYWHNHPSLSYLFSGMFIGPTSQAPRVDEARHDSLYELETAFDQLPESGPVPPWLTDRLFRHLLVDVTGNTHRAEFCIDKLFSPDGFSGRRGLVEMRAFEMPPHSQMSLAQHLLLRALVARFWDAPYRQKLVRWGTELHDRFCLPHFVWQDFEDVIAETNQWFARGGRAGAAADGAGQPLKAEWFQPHFEFRFPKVGDLNRRDVVLELRHAIEPWHVLGEEVVASGTTRFVDSSVERLQVKVRGMVEPRHVLLCNRQPVPLRPTGVNGEYVAGVRYRAWRPPSCLHPTIPVHAPLTFEIVDTWLRWSMGGCTYHVEHPGGRNTDLFPVNAYEAEARRAGRFFRMGHTPGPVDPPPASPTGEAPLTLDLRKVNFVNNGTQGTELRSAGPEVVGRGRKPQEQGQPTTL